MSQVLDSGTVGMKSPAAARWRLALTTAGLALGTLALMTMGSLVHGTGSSLACPDWPLCNGHVFPRMVGGVEFEHTHRLIALAVLLACGGVAARLRAVRPGERWLGYGGCGLLVLQASLGGLTVVLRLPPIVSIAHLAVSMTFLSLTLVLAARLAPVSPPAALSAARVGFALAAGAVFAQIVLGAVVRHLGAALACQGLPLCAGWSPPSTTYGWIHMGHRAFGLVALALTAYASLRARAALSASRGYARLALVPAALAGAQMALGLGVVLTGAPLELVTLHHVGGAALLGSLALLAALGSVARARGHAPVASA